MRYAAISMIAMGIWVMAFVSMADEDEWSQKAGHLLCLYRVS